MRKNIEQCAAAVYIVGGLEDAVIYLDALAGGGKITEAEADAIIERIGRKYEKMTVAEVEKIRAMF